MSFGSSAPQINYKPGGFNAGGISAYQGAGGNYNLKESPQLQGLIGGVQNTFQQQAGALGNLAQTVAPGFSQFRQAGLADIAQQGQANVSNLSDTLAQRRVLGSSFANSSIAQANADIEKQRTDFIAQSYLQELSASNQLIQEQYTASINSFQTGINQMNFEAGIAANLTQSANATMAAVATAQAKIDAASAAANAQGMGQAIGLGVGMIGASPTSLAGIAGQGLTGGPAFGGQSALTGGVYGGSSVNPLPGLSPSDYADGY
jgi:hypothetical protein